MDFVVSKEIDPFSKRENRVYGKYGNTRTKRDSWSLNVEWSVMIDGWERRFKILISRAGLCGSTSRVSVMTFKAKVLDL